MFTSRTPTAFSLQLKALRARFDLTQEQLAERTGCAVYTIRTYEMGTRRPSHEIAARLVVVFQLDGDEASAFLRLARSPLREPPGADLLSSVAEAAEPEPPRSLPFRHQLALPTAPNALVGRALELAQLAEYLHNPACRLLTLLGPGGVGKTRLALQLADDMARAGHFRDGVAWVELAPLTTITQIPAAIAEAVGVVIGGASAPEVHLITALGERQMLLVLDNLEHLLDGVGLINELIRQVPQLSLLVTSRERLQLQGEWVYQLDGLPIPVPDDPAAARSSALVLFLERTRQVDHTFTLTNQNMPAVSRICRLVEGLPLGIELAASWMRTLTCAEIADELARSLDLLRHTGREITPRHHSLRAVFNHSWQLLAPTEQATLAQLSVFRGSWDRQSAMIVANATPLSLAALIDATLIRRIAGSTRYVLHELVRQYAAEQIQDDSAAAERHALLFAGKLRGHVAALQSGDQQAALPRLRPDLDNIWAAWAWAVQARDLNILRHMARGVVTLCEDLGLLQEGMRWFGEAATALEAQQATTPVLEQVLGQMLNRYGYFLIRCGRLPEAEQSLRRALDLIARDEHAERGQLLTHLALVGHQQGQYAEGLGWAEQALTALDSIDDPFYTGLATCFAGMISLALGDDAQATASLNQSSALWQANGSPRGLVLVLCAQSELALAQGSTEQALVLAGRAVRKSAGPQDRWGLAYALTTLGRCALALGEGAEAGYLFAEGAEAARELGESWVLCQALVGSGWAALQQHEHSAAMTAFREAAQSAQQARMLPSMLHALMGLAVVALEHDSEHALAGLAVVCLHPATEQPVRREAQRRWADAIVRFGEERTAAIWSAQIDRSPDLIIDHLCATKPTPR